MGRRFDPDGAYKAKPPLAKAAEVSNLKVFLVDAQEVDYKYEGLAR